MKFNIAPCDEPCTLEECPPGLFLFGGEHFGFKSEYSTVKPDGFIQCDAFVVSSGEYFWGGAGNARDRAALMVQPIGCPENESETSIPAP